MAKIIIKNFRAIDYAEIEIKPFTVIIGEQASGKSTISKLVYFFETIPYEFNKVFAKYSLNKFAENKKVYFEGIDLNLESQKLEVIFATELRLKFHKFFNVTKGELFEINYKDSQSFFSVESVKSDISPWLMIGFSKDLFRIERIEDILKNSQKSIQNIERDGYSSKEIIQSSESFESNLHRSSEKKRFFIPASRSLISSILPASQSRFTVELGKSEDKQVDYFVKTFLEDIDYFKRNYLFGKSLDEVLDEFELKTGKENPQAKLLRDKIKTILKADYQNGSGGEQLLNSRFVKPIGLDKASSGQQEIVWILLTLLVLQLEEKESFVVIEEPEAHLYPKTQAQVVAYIAQFFNANEKNEIIITTHSPYILTVLNNLLLAKQISKKTNGVENQAIAAAIDPHTWLDIDKFSAYYVGRNNEGQFIKSIINPETGLISVNALDDASDDIMDTFDDLMDIYKTTAV